MHRNGTQGAAERNAVSSIEPALKIPDFVDERPISAFQYATITLCALVMFIDGFDTQAISYAAPYIAEEWGLSRQLLGPIFSSSLVGLMLGYLLVSPLSDRFGHKVMIITSTAIFSVATIAAVRAGSVTDLIILRLIVGLGLGACIPSAVALTAEFSPKRLRATFVLIIYCGFSLGFIAAGLASGLMIPAFGWRSLFLIGGLAPLLLVPALFLFLPESISFMVRKGYDAQKILGVFRRMDRSIPANAAPVFEIEGQSPESPSRAALSGLFTRERVLGTLLLWLVFAINLGEFYALQSWLPTIMMGMDYEMPVVVMATTLTTVGGIVVVFVIGPCMDRLGAFRALAALYLLGFVFVGLAGFSFGAPLWLLMIATFFAGCSISGGQKSVIALAAIFYPSTMRSTGVGWALGIGRIGGILGPLIVGFVLDDGWSPAAVFFAMAALMLVNSVLIAILGHYYESEPQSKLNHEK
jgi:AAHS family 4-hydroxybenzoate transporter-like MFS transporter